MCDLRFATWNANGISQHRLEIESFIINQKIDILLISESHCTSLTYFYIRGYKWLFTNHPDNKGHGGSGILIKNSLNFSAFNSICKPEIQMTAISLKIGYESINFASVYCPPKHKLIVDDFNNLFNALGSRFICGGDYNSKHTWWGSRIITTKGRQLFSCLNNNNLHTASGGGPTYWPTDPNKTPDLLDFFVYKGVPQTRLNVTDCLDLSSDHSPVIGTLFDAVLPLTKSLVNYSHCNLLIEERLDRSPLLKSSIDIDRATENFTAIIKEAIAESTTNYTVNRDCELSLEIRNLISNKRRLRKIWQRTRYPCDKTAFNRASKVLKIKLEQYSNDKSFALLKNADPLTSDSNSLFNLTKRTKRPALRNVPIKDLSDQWLRTNKEKADAFGIYLRDIFTPNARKIDTNSERTLLEVLESPYQMSLPLKWIQPSEVVNEIKLVKIKKSPGHDGINGRLIKSLPFCAVIVLTAIFNSIMRSGHFPNYWKTAEIIVINKIGKPEHNISSYRPISLLPIFSKIFERLLLTRLLPHLPRIVPNHQFGFKRQHGTVQQCHRVVSEIQKSFEKDSYCSAVFLDIKEAFDRVWHPGLIVKLKENLPSPFLPILISYLQDRKFYVRFKDEKSALHQIESGVPQGSVLGPILYTIYTSDMPTTTSILSATYADDTSFLCTRKCPVEASFVLQGHLTLFEAWCNTWRIQVNPTKCVHITFTLKSENCPAVTFYDTTIPSSDTVKYIGFHLDRRLTWRKHIEAKRKHLDLKVKNLYWLFKTNSGLSLENKIIIYKMVIKPVWTYGIELWGCACKSTINIIQAFQSKTLRLITSAPWFIRNTNIHRDLNIPTVMDEIQCFSSRHLDRASTHPNPLISDLVRPSSTSRRLKRCYVNDLPARN